MNFKKNCVTCLDWRLLDLAPLFCLAMRLASNSVFLDFTSLDKVLARNIRNTTTVCRIRIRSNLVHPAPDPDPVAM